jgi:hypothetical protein
VLMASPMAVRIAAAAALIFPLAFFMGMPFPLGLLELSHRPRGAVAWAWSMNGLFTTIGGVASALLALAFGFRLTILFSLGIYVMAGVAFAWIRETSRVPAAIPSEPAAVPTLPDITAIPG